MYDSIWKRLNQPLALTPQMVETFAFVLRMHELSQPSAAEIQARIAAAGNQERRAAARAMGQGAAGRGVAVINVQGPMVAYGDMFSESSGMQSYGSLAAQVRNAADDPNVGSILMIWDTPGGDVAQLHKLTDALAYAKSKKKVESFVDGLMASAGLWAGSQTERVTAHRMSDVGSLGVIAIHTSRQKQREDAGLKDTIITSSPLKAAGNSYQDLSDEAEAELRRGIQAVHAMFVQSVAQGRGVSVEKAQQWATGQVWGADEALELGLIDEIGTLESVIERLASTGQPVSNGPSRLQPRGQGARKMDELLKALGLPEGATEAEALEALSALQAKAGEVEGLKAKLTEAEETLELSVKVNEIGTQSIKDHTEAYTALEAKATAAERAALEAQVELALTVATREGRANPATAATLREQVLGTEEAAGTLTLEGLKAMLETLPVMPQSVVNPPKAPNGPQSLATAMEQLKAEGFSPDPAALIKEARRRFPYLKGGN